MPAETPRPGANFSRRLTDFHRSETDPGIPLHGVAESSPDFPSSTSAARAAAYRRGRDRVAADLAGITAGAALVVEI